MHSSIIANASLSALTIGMTAEKTMITDFIDAVKMFDLSPMTSVGVVLINWRTDWTKTNYKEQ